MAWTDAETLALLTIVHECNYFGAKLNYDQLGKELVKILPKDQSGAKRQVSAKFIRDRIKALVRDNVLPSKEETRFKVRDGEKAKDVIATYAAWKGYYVEEGRIDTSQA